MANTAQGTGDFGSKAAHVGAPADLGGKSYQGGLEIQEFKGKDLHSPGGGFLLDALAGPSVRGLPSILTAENLGGI